MVSWDLAVDIRTSCGCLLSLTVENGLFLRTSKSVQDLSKRAHLGPPAFQSLCKDKTIEQDRGRVRSPLRPWAVLDA